MRWKEKIPEIVIGLVLIGGGGWLINQTYAINRAVGSLEAKVDAKLSEHWGRIERIASVLPDVRIRIAKEELSKPVATAVVVVDPVKTSKGNWIAGLHVIDTMAMTKSTYLVPVKGPEDKEVAWLASGAAVETDPDAVSFKSLAAFSSDVGTPTAAPGYVIPHNSYVLRKPSAAYIKSLNGILRGKSAMPETASLPINLNSWEKLTAELKQNHEKYMIKPK
ncbi:MAG: hypothetical protein AB1641_13635 [Thermodesulfobacteriota bacterium]